MCIRVTALRGELKYLVALVTRKNMVKCHHFVYHAGDWVESGKGGERKGDHNGS